MKHQQLKTPYLYVDYRKLVNNIKTMADACRQHGVRLKPHCKSHKTLEIAQLQLEYGAIGITAATLKEVNYLLESGIKQITLAYPLITEVDLELFTKLGLEGDLETIVLNKDHGEILNTYFEGKKPLKVWLKVDTGLHRLGVPPKDIEETLSSLEAFPNIKVKGLLTHGGHSYAGGDLEAIGKSEGAELVAHKKLPLQVSCGSTPTAKWVVTVPGVNEIRPGNYVFYDNTMLSLGVCQKDDCSLMVKSTIIGVYEDHLVIDAGSKTLGLDQGVHGNSAIKGFGSIVENENLIIEKLSEEHGIVGGEGLSTYHLGDTLTIIPNHACSVVNLANEIWVLRNHKIEEKYIVKGRGH